MSNVARGLVSGGRSVAALKHFINKDLVLGETPEYTIPGTQFRGRGISAERFLDICRAYVSALQGNTLTSDRQREIAVKCSILLGSCAKVGLIALIDEATGYQEVREEDALQVKLRAFIAEELRAWEKTFPDELWEEFGRLTNWQRPLHNRPKYWGKLVIELIYDTLDPDVARYLRENRPPIGIRWHQQLSEDHGVHQLVSRCYEIVGLAKSCKTMDELKNRVSHHYGGQKSLAFSVYSDYEKEQKKKKHYHIKKREVPHGSANPEDVAKVIFNAADTDLIEKIKK